MNNEQTLAEGREWCCAEAIWYGRSYTPGESGCSHPASHETLLVWYWKFHGPQNSPVLSLVTQSCPTLCNLKDYSPPGSSVHGNSPGKSTGMGCQALLQGIFSTHGSNPGLPPFRQILYHLNHQGSPRILEWVAYSFSKVLRSSLVFYFI